MEIESRIHTLKHEKHFLDKVGTGKWSTHVSASRLSLLVLYRMALKNKSLKGWYARKVKSKKREEATPAQLVQIKGLLFKYINELIKIEQGKIGWQLSTQ